MPRAEFQSAVSRFSKDARSSAKRAWPDRASAAGASACVRKSPVRSPGAGDATITPAGAPTTTVKDRTSSNARSSLPSMTTRPCRVPGSSPAMSKSTAAVPASLHSTGFTARRAYRPSGMRISTATDRVSSGPVRASVADRPTGVPAAT